MSAASIYFVLTRPDRTALLIQLSFNARTDMGGNEYLMQAVNQAIDNVMQTPPSMPAHLRPRQPLMSPASTRASNSLFRSLSDMLRSTPTPRSASQQQQLQSPAMQRAASDSAASGATEHRSQADDASVGGSRSPGAGRSDMNELMNDFLQASIMDHVRSRLDAIDEEFKDGDEQQHQQQHPQQYTDASATHFTPPTGATSTAAVDFSGAYSADRSNDTASVSPPPPPPLDTRNLSTVSAIDDASVDSPPPLLEASSQPPLHPPSSPSSSPLLRPNISRAFSEPNPNAPPDFADRTAPASPSSVIHRGVTCDNCNMSPLRGPRWKCRQCPDFDLCGRCHLLNPTMAPHMPSHTYQLFTQPRPDPLVCALTDFLHLILASGFISVRMIGGVPQAGDSVLNAVMAASMQGGTHYIGTRPAALAVREGLEKVEVGESVAGAMCVVCQQAFEVGEVSTFLPSCHHMFHIDCIQPWLERHSECPTCRAKLKDVDEEEAENKAKESADGRMDMDDEHKSSTSAAGSGSGGGSSGDGSGPQVIHRYTAYRTANQPPHCCNPHADTAFSMLCVPCAAVRQSDGGLDGSMGHQPAD